MVHKGYYARFRNIDTTQHQSTILQLTINGRVVTIKHNCIELGSGVFDKPQALGDFLVQNTSVTTVVICPNGSDIRFVENILRKRSLPARRITNILEENELSQVLSWLESQKKLILVCGTKVGQKIAAKWGSIIICYSPLSDIDSYKEISIETDSGDRSVLTLVSPTELLQYVSIKNGFPQIDNITISEESSFKAQKSLLDEVLKNLPARGSLLANELTKNFAADLGISNIDSESGSFTTLKKLVTFLMEQHLGGVPKNSIEEELLLVQETIDQDEYTSNHKKKSYQEKSDYRPKGNRDREGNRDRNREGHTGPRDDSYSGSSKSSGSSRKNSSHFKEDRGHDKGKRGSYKKNQKPAPQYFPVRVYVGLGDENGLKPHEIKDFISTTADVDREEIGFATVRNNYSFVDLTKGAAEQALSRESGYEFEGRLITVERALTASPSRKRNYRPKNSSPDNDDRT
jgi:hypothetical protein